MDFDELDALDPVEVPELGRPIGITVLGATGFTGGLIVQHLDALGSEVPWAIAGRNLSKLRTVASNCRQKPMIFHVADKAQLEHMASKSQVVISAVGPYSQCGEAGEACQMLVLTCLS